MNKKKGISVMKNIDVIITWVDGNDLAWQSVKNKYVIENKNGDDRKSRYRDWDNLKYIFRGIEKYMPWIHKVHFVTWGHLPDWMNIECKKLNIVKHEDFIPEKYLPTFNSNTIELNLHRIPELAEYYINFNDDMFVIGMTDSKDFFVNGLPKDMAILSPQPIKRGGIACTVVNNLEVINDYFTPLDIRNNKGKWFSHKYGKMLLRNFIFSKFTTIIGIYETHIPFSHLKSTAVEVWDKEGRTLENTCLHKFRSKEDVNEWLFRHWQLMSGKFLPRRADFGLLRCLPDHMDEIVSLILNPGNIKMLCINDSEEEANFEKDRDTLNTAFKKVFPIKSMFEK